MILALYTVFPSQLPRRHILAFSVVHLRRQSRMVKWLAQGCTARKWWGQGSDPNILAPESVPLEKQTTKHSPETHYEKLKFYNQFLIFSFGENIQGPHFDFLLPGQPYQAYLIYLYSSFSLSCHQNLSVFFSVFGILTFIYWLWLAKPGLITYY